jgi:hypothetical protein
MTVLPPHRTLVCSTQTEHLRKTTMACTCSVHNRHSVVACTSEGWQHVRLVMPIRARIAGTTQSPTQLPSSASHARPSQQTLLVAPSRAQARAVQSARAGRDTRATVMLDMSVPSDNKDRRVFLLSCARVVQGSVVYNAEQSAHLLAFKKARSPLRCRRAQQRACSYRMRRAQQQPRRTSCLVWRWVGGHPPQTEHREATWWVTARLESVGSTYGTRTWVM